LKIVTVVSLFYISDASTTVASPTSTPSEPIPLLDMNDYMTVSCVFYWDHPIIQKYLSLAKVRLSEDFPSFHSNPTSTFKDPPPVPPAPDFCWADFEDILPDHSFDD
jgi:hypothetical protein